MTVYNQQNCTEPVTYCYYELKKYDGFDKGYIGVKKEELSEKSSDYKMTDDIGKMV